jgi:hypothetical protein
VHVHYLLFSRPVDEQTHDLVDLRGRIERANKSPRSYSVAVRTDSRLPVGQLT